MAGYHVVAGLDKEQQHPRIKQEQREGEAERELQDIWAEGQDGDGHQDENEEYDDINGQDADQQLAAYLVDLAVADGFRDHPVEQGKKGVDHAMSVIIVVGWPWLVFPF